MDQRVRLLYNLMLGTVGKMSYVENLSKGITVHKTGDLRIADHVFNNQMIKFIKSLGIKISKKKPVFKVHISGNISIINNDFSGNNMKAPWLAVEPCKKK